MDKFLEVNPAHKQTTLCGVSFNDECSKEDAADILAEIMSIGGKEISHAELEKLLTEMSARETAQGNAQSPSDCYEIMFDWNWAVCVNGKCYACNWVIEKYKTA